MSEKDWRNVILFVAGIILLALVLWLVGSIIQFLSDHRFVYGLLVGLALGIGGTILVVRWRNR